MRLATFNLRYDNPHDGPNSFSFRKPLILRAISAEAPDVICFQEVLPHMAAWLRESLTDYDVIGCGRGEKLDGEQVSVAFRRREYQLLEMRTFWLSETPFVPGSRYPGQSACPRTCTGALLLENGSGRVFRVMNTHLDHEGKEARERGLRQILRSAAEERLFPDAPLILAGDFNAEPDSEEMAPLRESAELRCATDGIGVTWHGFGRAEHPGQIDYIVLRGNAFCRGIRKWTEHENGVYLSDHYPVCADIRLE